MNDIPPTDESSEVPPPPPPPGAEPVDGDTDYFNGLRRSRSDRVVGGVAGGLGQYFGIDPVIVRVAFIVLALFSGAGFLLYLLGWVVIAKEGRDESSAMRALRGSPDGNRGLLFIVLAVGAILVLSTPLIWWDGFGFGDGLALPLLLIAAGVAFLIWPADRGWTSRTHDQYDAPRGPPVGAEPPEPDSEPAASTGGEIRIELRGAADDLKAAGEEIKAAGAEVRSEFAEARDSFNQRRRTWRHGYRRGGHHGHRPTYVRPPRPPKPAPFLGPLTMASLLVFAGIAIVGEQSDWWDLDPAVYGGIVLAVLGVALILSAFFGRARGLIFVGMLVLPVAWFLAAIDLNWYDGAGEKSDIVESIDEVEAEYFYGFGDYEVDLSQVDFTGTDRTIEIGLTMGELSVWVPDDVTIEIESYARAGEVEILSGTTAPIHDEGFPAEADGRFVGDADGTLTLDVEVGFGAIDIHVCTNDPEQVGVPCP